MKSLFANVNPDDLAVPSAPPPADAERRRIGSSAVKSMDRAFVTIEEENKRLHSQLVSAEVVVELDPDKVEASFVKDRLEMEDDEGFSSFVESIRENGQKLPILVRPLAGKPGFYQAAYGHRRLRACKILRRPVKAIVRDLSDEELVVSQGIENAERLNLSFIEQAFFALALKDKGYSRETIAEALGRREKKGLAYISHLTNVASMLPETLVREIGPAPNIGRPNWEKLGALVEHRRLTEWQRAQLERLINAPTWRLTPSDQRFALVTRSFDRPDPSSKDAREISLGQGLVATIQMSGKASKISLPERSIPGLTDWLVDRLPELVDEYRSLALKEQKR